MGTFTSAKAQEYPSWEFEGHYSYVRFTASGTATGFTTTSSGSAMSLCAAQMAPLNPSKTVNLNGGGGSIAFNVNRWFGLATDLGGYHNGGVTDSRLPGVSADLTIFS